MNKKVLAFYYPWFGSPKHSKQWLKWKQGGHDPDRKIKGLPDIASADHPLLGAYDSSDPAVIKEHLRMAKEAGINALLVSIWEQKMTHTHKNFEKMLSIADKTPGVKLTFYYEDLPNSFEPEKVAKHLIGLINKYGKHKSFFRVNGKPFIILYARVLMQLGLNKWLVVRDLVKKATGAYLIVDSKYEEWVSNFDGAFRYTYLDALFNKKNMFTEYSKIKGMCDKHKKICVLTVMPGYDDSGVKEIPKEFIGELAEGLKSNFSIKRVWTLFVKLLKRLARGDFKWILITLGIKHYAVVSREKGSVYKRCWEAAIKKNPQVVSITSFNEWHEGTEIEPSHEYGNEYIKLTRKYSKEFKANKKI
ncbi:MAG: glycoside hydrolase family 99-like domain-containing protein [Candidatus Nanoarchaeia archaeon]|jgi:hypothetical protein